MILDLPQPAGAWRFGAQAGARAGVSQERALRRTVRIGLIGDYAPTVPAHRAIPVALRRGGEAAAVEVAYDWLPTDELCGDGGLAEFDGFWCVPGSPYRSTDGALLAIRYARERGRPFLGTCGGFQHAVLEFARNVVGWSDAEHAETTPDAARPVITPLTCALHEAAAGVRLHPGSRIAGAYGTSEASERYRCGYGINPELQSGLLAGPLHAVAEDVDGAVRAVELEGHPFFVATLFQPERAALEGRVPPLVGAFVEACVRQAVAQGMGGTLSA